MQSSVQVDIAPAPSPKGRGYVIGVGAWPRPRHPHNTPTPPTGRPTPMVNASPHRQGGAKWRTVASRYKKRCTTPICHLCQALIDKTLAWPHPRSFSVDHVVPTVDGGPEFDPSNLAPAHLECNQRRTRTRPPAMPLSRRW